MTADPKAYPDDIAARAAELAIEQMDRLRDHIAHGGNTNGSAFYTKPFEIGISNEIGRLMAKYAVLKGYVTAERAMGQIPEPQPQEGKLQPKGEPNEGQFEQLEEILDKPTPRIKRHGGLFRPRKF